MHRSAIKEDAMSVQRLSATDRSARLDQAVNQYVAQGYQVTDLRNSTAVLRRGKRWNWAAFIVGGVLTGGLFCFIYPLYYALFGKGQILELNVDAVGNVKGSRRAA
jgi:hypothetical protein